VKATTTAARARQASRRRLSARVRLRMARRRSDWLAMTAG
jgi:hypothetical protein